MSKECITCGKRLIGKWNHRKWCGSLSDKTSCYYKGRWKIKPLKEKTLKEKVEFSYKNYQWRINNLHRENYFCQDCKIKGRQLTILDFPDLPVLYINRKKSINNIIKDNNITTVEEAELCNEFWIDGEVLCVSCFDKKRGTNLADAQKSLKKYLLKKNARTSKI